MFYNYLIQIARYKGYLNPRRENTLKGQIKDFGSKVKENISNAIDDDVFHTPGEKKRRKFKKIVNITILTLIFACCDDLGTIFIVRIDQMMTVSF